MPRGGIVFTVVPTNSYYMRTLAPERWAADHPIRRMAELGLRSIQHDDPTLHQRQPGRRVGADVHASRVRLDDLAR